VDNQLRSLAHERGGYIGVAVCALRIGPNGSREHRRSAPSAFAIVAKEAEGDISRCAREELDRQPRRQARTAAPRKAPNRPPAPRRPGSCFVELRRTRTMSSATAQVV